VADAGDVPVPPRPLVLANLLGAAHRELGPRYRAWVAPGGALVLGGLLDGEADEIAAAVAAHGFAPIERLSLEGWTSLALRRGAG
jgi:ribosomal protein L11 methyltransferase